jgi:hypothetical protein
MKHNKEHDNHENVTKIMAAESYND